MENHFKIKAFITAIFFVLALGLNNSVADYPNTSIGVIDTAKILTEAKAMKDALKEIEKINKKTQDEVREIEEALLNEQSELVESQSIMAPEAFQVKAAEFEKKVQNFQIESQDKFSKINNQLVEAEGKIFEVLKPIIADIVKEKGITIVLEKPRVVFNDEDMDITDEALKKLNKSLSKIDMIFE